LAAEFEVVMPRLGVNEDAVVIIAWHVKDGDRVHIGQKLADLETTKASVVLEAEAEGYIHLYVEAGEEVQVQDVVAVILDEADPERAGHIRARTAPKEKARTGAHGTGDLKVTAQAQRLIESASVDVSLLPRDRIVRESDVRALIGSATQEAGPAGDPSRRVVVYGASQGGFAAAETLLAMGGYEVVAYLDDTPGRAGQSFQGLPIWSGDELAGLASRGIGGVITHIMVREFRLGLRDRARVAGLAMPNAIHPRAYVAPSARIGVGNLIKAGAIVDAEVHIGDCCIIDNGVVISHNNVIGDACSLAPGVTMAGDSRVGERTLLGTGATVSERLSIGVNAIVSPGAVVVRDVPDNAVVAGSPARVVGERR
jgi:UDP-perosamine 4-acetyltransferase